jgi:hypothetical protein
MGVRRIAIRRYSACLLLVALYVLLMCGYRFPLVFVCLFLRLPFAALEVPLAIPL